MVEPASQRGAKTVVCPRCDDEASHDDLCEPLALLEPMPTEAMASPKEMVEPTTYTLSRLDQLLHPSMTEVWGRVSTWPLELATFSTAEPCRPQVPQIRRAGHLRERRGYRMLPECAELPPERGRATRVMPLHTPLPYRDGPHRRATDPLPVEGKGGQRRAPLPPTRQPGRPPHGDVALQPAPTWLTQQPGPQYCGGDPPPRARVPPEMQPVRTHRGGNAPPRALVPLTRLPDALPRARAPLMRRPVRTHRGGSAPLRALVPPTRQPV